MFTLTFRTDNATFDGDPNPETARILRAVADQIETGQAPRLGYIFDVNGNRIGTFEVMPDD